MMLFACMGGDRTEQVYMTALWNSFETTIQQAEHVVIVNYYKSLISTPSINEINIKEIDLYKSGID